jgi:CheY-like chemotaxis protein
MPVFYAKFVLTESARRNRFRQTQTPLKATRLQADCRSYATRLRLFKDASKSAAPGSKLVPENALDKNLLTIEPTSSPAYSPLEIEKSASKIDALPIPDVVSSPRDRRDRVRVQIEVPVRIRGGLGSKAYFEDVVKTVNITRSGLLFETRRTDYFVGDLLEVTCPYWENPTAINTPRQARVLRTAFAQDNTHAVALQYSSDLATHVDPITARYAPSSEPNRIKILAVESDPDLAFALRSMLEHDGYTIVVVPAACDALSILATEIPDALIIEAEGQDLCGKDLCAIVKMNERLQKIPIILLTTSALPSDYATAHRLGAVVCMMRPCKPMQIRRAVHLVAPPPGTRSIYSARFNVSQFVRTS